jgi:hypothetical protein
MQQAGSSETLVFIKLGGDLQQTDIIFIAVKTKQITHNFLRFSLPSLVPNSH